MAIDPRSIIGEILSRRPDLRRAYAPQAEALGIQIAGLKPAVETRRRLEAANALRSGQVPDTTLGPVPPNMGNMGAPLASASPPLPIPGFSGETRRRLDAANAAPSSDYADYEAQRAAMRSPMGDQGPLQPLPGSMDYGRERERALMRSPFGDQGPPEGLQPSPPGLATRGPMPPSFGANPSIQDALSNRAAAIRNSTPFTGNPPQPRQTMAPGSAERLASPLPPLPQARPNPGITPGPMPPSMGLPQRPTLSSDTSGLPPQIADLMGGKSPIAPGIPPSGAPFSPYGPDASLARMPQYRPPNIPQARPPQGMSITASPPEAPLSPDQRISNVPGSGPAPPVDPAIAAAAQRAVAPPVAGFDPRSPFSRPTSPLTPNLRGERLDLTQGTSPPSPQIGSTVLSPLVQDYATGNYTPPGTQPAQLARMPRPRPPIEQQPGDLIAKPAAVPPPDTVTGQDLPAPGSTSSILTPQQIQRTMGAQALYNTLPPGVTQQDVGRLGFGAIDIDPSKAPVQRYGSGTGKIAGTVIGGLKGLASGGPLGALVGGYLGNRAGKRVGGLADRDFGLGARFTNPNYAQGVVANPPPIMDMSVPPITPPAQTPILQAGTGGIFGQGRSMLGGAAQKILSAVRSGKMPLEAAAKALGMPADSLRDSLGSMGSGGRGMGGMGGYGGGGYGGGSYQGGGYGGFGGSRINEGIGQRFGQR